MPFAPGMGPDSTATPAMQTSGDAEDTLDFEPPAFGTLDGTNSGVRHR